MAKAPGYHAPQKGHGKPDYWSRFKRIYGINAEQAIKIRQAAQDAKLDPTYLAAYLYRTQSLNLGTQAMKRVAFRESQRGPTRPAIVDWLTGQDKFHKWEPKVYTTVGGQTRRDRQLLNARDPMVFVGKKSVKLGGIIPIRQSQFNTYWQSYNDLYQYYLGRNAHKGEVAKILQSGKVSKYSIINHLVNQPGFYKGYAWKQHAESYKAVYAGVYGPDANAPRKAIKKAILNNWDQGAFEQYIRGLPQYMNSAEVQHNADQLAGTYYSIMGPTAKVSEQKQINTILKLAAYHQWDAVQLSAWLRDPSKNPNYVHSFEQRQQAGQVAASFGIDLDTLGLKQRQQAGADQLNPAPPTSPTAGVM